MSKLFNIAHYASMFIEIIFRIKKIRLKKFHYLDFEKLRTRNRTIPERYKFR